MRHEELRVPPNAIEHEQNVLGGLMLVPRAWDDVADLLKPEDFYRRDHQLIFRAIRERATAAPAKPFDESILAQWFKDQGADEVVPGHYLTELASTTPSAANIRAYAEIVADKAMRRRMIDIGTEIVSQAFDQRGAGTLDLLGKAQNRFSDLMQDQPCELEPLAPVMERVHERLEHRCRHEGGIHGLTTGLDELDELIGGLKPGGLYLLAARPKMGKTTLAQNIAEHIAIVRGLPVAVFSFEMQPDELGDRMLSSIGDVDGDKIRRGELDNADWGNITKAMRTLRAAPIMVSRPRSAYVEHVVAQIRRQHARKPVGLVVIDYLQLMQTRGDNRAQGIGEITRALKLLAGELGIAILLLSQLNRDVEKRPDRRPQPSDLRDSGAIEQDADAVIFIYRDEVYHRDSQWKGTAEIDVPMQRNGPAGMVRAKYEPARFRFSNLPEDWEPAPLPEKTERKPRRGLAGAVDRRAAAGGPDA